MRKADSLRQWLLQALPEFTKHPDRLSLYVERGRVLSRQSKTLSFTMGYTLKVLVTDFSGDQARLMVAVLAWIETQQPHLLRKANDEAFTFEAEILNGDVYDIEMSIDLTETVLVLLRDDQSGFDLDHPLEPDLSDRFPGVTSTFRQGYGNAELLVESQTP